MKKYQIAFAILISITGGLLWALLLTVSACEKPKPKQTKIIVIDKPNSGLQFNEQFISKKYVDSPSYEVVPLEAIPGTKDSTYMSPIINHSEIKRVKLGEDME